MLSFNMKEKVFENLVSHIFNSFRTFEIGNPFFDNSVISRAKKLQPSLRGEIEIIDIIKSYIKDDFLDIEILGRGTAWIDTGTCNSMNDASSFIRTLEERQGLKIGCPEEVAWRQGWIDIDTLIKKGEELKGSEYGEYLLQIAEI